MRADDDSYLNIPVIMHMLQQQRAKGPERAFWCGFNAALALGHLASAGKTVANTHHNISNLMEIVHKGCPLALWAEDIR